MIELLGAGANLTGIIAEIEKKLAELAGPAHVKEVEEIPTGRHPRRKE